VAHHHRAPATPTIVVGGLGDVALAGQLLRDVLHVGPLVHPHRRQSGATGAEGLRQAPRHVVHIVQRRRRIGVDAGRVLNLAARFEGDPAAVVDLELAHTRCRLVSDPQATVIHSEITDRRQHASRGIVEDHAHGWFPVRIHPKRKELRLQTDAGGGRRTAPGRKGQEASPAVSVGK
jgi:hypothetical protein